MMFRQIILATLFLGVTGFAPVHHTSRPNHQISTSELAVSTASPRSSFGRNNRQRTSRTNNSGQRRVKTVQDRTPEETLALIKDVVQAARDAGPRAGPLRTLQAQQAAFSTMQEFLPTILQGGRVEFPAVLRTLFERLGATYIKLGQYV